MRRTTAALDGRAGARRRRVRRQCGGARSRSQAGKATGTINVWAWGNEGELLGEMTKQFEAENPGTKVNVTAVPVDAAHDKILTSRRRQPGARRRDGRHDLDGRARAHEHARRGARRRSTSPSSSRARATPTSSTARPTACRGTSRRGCCTTAPTSPRRPASPRRPRPGTSSRRRRARCRTRAARSTASTSRPTTGRSTCRSSGRPAATSPRATSSRSNSPQAAEATGFYKSFADEGLSPNTTKQGFDITPAFVRGTHPMFFSGPWHMGLIKEAGGEGFEKKWAVAPMPTKETNTSSSAAATGPSSSRPRTATRRGSSSSGCPSPRRRPSGTRSPATCPPTRPPGTCPRWPRTRT